MGVDVPLITTTPIRGIADIPLSLEDALFHFEEGTADFSPSAKYAVMDYLGFFKTWTPAPDFQALEARSQEPQVPRR